MFVSQVQLGKRKKKKRGNDVVGKRGREKKMPDADWGGETESPYLPNRKGKKIAGVDVIKKEEEKKRDNILHSMRVNLRK